MAVEVVNAVKEARASGTMLKGRQILYMICKQFEEDDDRCFTNDLGDIEALKWLGDEQLLKFKSNWDDVVGGLREPQSSDNLRALFYERIKTSKVLAIDLNTYERARRGERDT